jgi:DNA-binding GntR family transcriptional regulator
MLSKILRGLRSGRLEAVSANATVTRSFGIGLDSPVFQIERMEYTTELQPIDFEKL